MEEALGTKFEFMTSNYNFAIISVEWSGISCEVYESKLLNPAPNSAGGVGNIDKVASSDIDIGEVTLKVKYDSENIPVVGGLAEPLKITHPAGNGFDTNGFVSSYTPDAFERGAERFATIVVPFSGEFVPFAAP